MRCCKNCRYWEEFMPISDEPDEDRVGDCQWPVPAAWEYTQRDVTAMSAIDGQSCPTFEEKQQ